MRKLFTALAAVLGVSLALPALAEEEKKKEAKPAAEAKAAPDPSKVRPWLPPRLRKVANRIRKAVGQDNWGKIKEFWKETIRDRIKPGKGRRKRGFIRFARNYARALKKNKLDDFLKAAKERWEKRPVVGKPADKPADKPAEPK
jgi:hypothetical protein